MMNWYGLGAGGRYRGSSPLYHWRTGYLSPSPSSPSSSSSSPSWASSLTIKMNHPDSFSRWWWWPWLRWRTWAAKSVLRWVTSEGRSTFNFHFIFFFSSFLFFALSDMRGKVNFHILVYLFFLTLFFSTECHLSFLSFCFMSRVTLRKIYSLNCLTFSLTFPVFYLPWNLTFTSFSNYRFCIFIPSSHFYFTEVLSVG